MFSAKRGSTCHFYGISENHISITVVRRPTVRLAWSSGIDTGKGRPLRNNHSWRYASGSRRSGMGPTLIFRSCKPASQRNPRPGYHLPAKSALSHDFSWIVGYSFAGYGSWGMVRRYYRNWSHNPIQIYCRISSTILPALLRNHGRRHYRLTEPHVYNLCHTTWCWRWVTVSHAWAAAWNTDKPMWKILYQGNVRPVYSGTGSGCRKVNLRTRLLLYKPDRNNSYCYRRSDWPKSFSCPGEP